MFGGLNELVASRPTVDLVSAITKNYLDGACLQLYLHVKRVTHGNRYNLVYTFYILHTSQVS